MAARRPPAPPRRRYHCVQHDEGARHVGGRRAGLSGLPRGCGAGGRRSPKRIVDSVPGIFAASQNGSGDLAFARHGWQPRIDVMGA